MEINEEMCLEMDEMEVVGLVGGGLRE